MDAARRLGDDAWTSLRTLWREELWLPAGLPVAGVADVLWLGTTIAALSLLVDGSADAGGLPAWLATTPGSLAGALLWILGPAAVATVLAVARVKNVNGNVRHGYRLRHPLGLLLWPAAVLALGFGLLGQSGGATQAALGLGVAGGIWLAVRTLAYSYRVFSLGYPIFGQAVALATASVLAVASLVAAGLAAGREPAVSALLEGLAETTGRPAIATAHVDVVTVDGTAVPLLAAAAVATPVAASAAYVGPQVAWSVLVRLWRPTVKRPELRTGQRYPAFARPTTRPLPTVLGDLAGIPADYRPGALVSRVWPRNVPGSASSTAEAGSGATGSQANASGGEATPETDSGPRSVYRGGRGETGSVDASSADDGTSGGTDGSDPDSGTVTGSQSGDAGATDDGSDDASAENVSHTRVFTPPEDADFEVTGHCPACGDPVDATADDCPSCGAALDGA